MLWCRHKNSGAIFNNFKNFSSLTHFLSFCFSTSGVTSAGFLTLPLTTTTTSTTTTTTVRFGSGDD